MLQIAGITAFTVSELLRENQQGGNITPQPRLELARRFFTPKILSSWCLSGVEFQEIVSGSGLRLP